MAQGRGAGTGLGLKGLDVANDVEYVRGGRGTGNDCGDASGGGEARSGEFGGHATSTEGGPSSGNYRRERVLLAGMFLLAERLGWMWLPSTFSMEISSTTSIGFASGCVRGLLV